MTLTVAPLRPPLGRTGPRLVSRRALAGLLGAGLVLGALGMVGLWWKDNPSIGSLGAALTGAGQLAGLLGGYLLLVEIGLMARVPVLERGLGSDWTARLHRAFGEYLVCLLVGHAVLITLGYAATRRAGVLPEAVTIVFRYPEMLKAIVALGLLVAIGVLSARAVRPRMRYETWHFTHLYAYLALLLAYGHQVATGQQFVTNRALAHLWLAAHLAVGALVLTFRVAVPLIVSGRHRLQVAAVVPEGQDTVSVYVTGRDLHRLRAEPGQFFRWRFLAPGYWWAALPLSLSAAPDGRYLRVTVKAAGAHTRALRRLRPGTRLLVEGPYGAVTARLRTRPKVLLVAGGAGIGPMRALLDRLDGDVVLLYRASTRAHLALHDELASYAAAGRLRLVPLVGPRRRVPFTARAVRGWVPDVAERDVFVCGSPGLVDAASGALRAAGVPRRRLHVERFEV